jgi:hypothetical protein
MWLSVRIWSNLLDTVAGCNKDRPSILVMQIKTPPMLPSRRYILGLEKFGRKGEGNAKYKT